MLFKLNVLQLIILKVLNEHIIQVEFFRIYSIKTLNQHVVRVECLRTDKNYLIQGPFIYYQFEHFYSKPFN